ncbi:MAG TPA: hypothetical protein VF790_09210 [Dissulfurispiraceae bacterium]
MKGYFLRSINVVNIVLAAAVVLSAKYMVLPLIGAEAKYTPPQVKTAASAAEEKAAQAGPLSAPDYAMVAEKNPFHPERKIPAEKAAAGPGAAAAQPQPKPEFVLYGTLITDGKGFAYMEDKRSPRSTPGRGKRMTVLRKGDSLSGFMLKDIGKDKVVMARGGEDIVVYLNETKQRTTELPGDHSRDYARDYSKQGSPVPGQRSPYPAPGGTSDLM